MTSSALYQGPDLAHFAPNPVRLMCGGVQGDVGSCLVSEPSRWPILDRHTIDDAAPGSVGTVDSHCKGGADLAHSGVT